ncbi:hypothetical protein IMZ48_43670 [Candidatus Bathyarchaeota archaeon]|nr:hypothetical protein [Candidatus Bathyarchaeota archaeon]
MTDHLNYKHLATKAKLSAKEARQAEELLVFDFEIVYREGTKNLADALSRRLDHFSDADKQAARQAPLQGLLSRFKTPGADPTVALRAAVAAIASLTRSQTT